MIAKLNNWYYKNIHYPGGSGLVAIIAFLLFAWLVLAACGAAQPVQIVEFEYASEPILHVIRHQESGMVFYVIEGHDYFHSEHECDTKYSETLLWCD